jgi:hypothetical protein
MIRTRKFWALWLFLGTAFAWGPTVARVEGLEVKSAGDISYVSGGIGASEQEALELVKSDYNLQLTFAVSGSGAFLAKIPVTITDTSGQVVVEAVSAGPYFFARLPAGSYRVSAEHDSQVQARSVAVPATGAASEGFSWSPEQ